VGVRTVGPVECGGGCRRQKTGRWRRRGPGGSKGTGRRATGVGRASGPKLESSPRPESMDGRHEKPRRTKSTRS